MAVINSPNMTLPVPGVGTELGPVYAFDVNSCFTLIDQHDHTPGKGIQITPAGLNINTDLPFGGNSATNLLNVVFNTQSGGATGILQALSVAPGDETVPLQDLWYTDSAGNKVQITSGGQLAAVATTVSGISYALGTFSFRQSQDSLPATPANLDGGTVTIRPNIDGTANGVTLAPSSSISSAYTLTLPLPVAATNFVTQDSSGVLTGSIPTAAGIQQSMMAANSVGNSQLIDLNVSTAKLAAGAVTATKNTITTAQNAFGPVAIPVIASGWYTVASSSNSIFLPAGTWRLSGTANWLSTGNVIADPRIGYFGVNGTNTTTTPTALTVASQIGGRLGEIKTTTVSGQSMLNVFVNAPETIIVLTTGTNVFLNLFHGAVTGFALTYQGTISAQQIA